jgi:capsular exopolysaccharide synthesis family protein
MVAVVAAFTAGGLIATRLVKPMYNVQGTIWIQAETPMSQRGGAFKSPELLNSQAWVELLLSSRVADAVVRQLALYLRPADPADSVAFRGFSIADHFAPGTYQLDLDKIRQRWHLQLASGVPVDSGGIADSVGKAIGFKWQLTPAAFEGATKKKVVFTVLTPRETANDYAGNRLGAKLPDKSSFLTIAMLDPDPHGSARTINAWMREYVGVAEQLKKANIVQYSGILAQQVGVAERSLHDAENALENFKVHTITQPSESSPVSPGIQQTSDPAIKNYFDQKFDYDALRHDREALEKILANPRDSVSVEAALFIPAVSSFPSAKALRDAFDQLNKARADLATARLMYTDEYATVRDLKTNIDQIETQTIPRLASNLLTQLKERESQYEQRIAGESVDLQAIPARTIEEMRLTRQVKMSEQLYNTLKMTYTDAQLSEAGATPDVTVLDTAIAPLAPVKNTAPRMIAIAVMMGIGAALALALLLDAIDGRIRYPDQVTHDLGLNIAAAIPRFPRGTVNTRSPEQIAHLVESFRSLRMHVQHASATPITLAISSPQPGDGKSFVSANLAMSFADAGYRTILVDGDTRRGLAHEVFGLSMENGLTDFLSGRADMSQIIRRTAHERLAFLSCGGRRPNSPELLTSAALPRLIADLRSRYDVVLFDTPPLNAGIDAYAIGSALASMVVVIRAGKTDRRLTAAKLLLADRLPIQIVGAVLNAVQLENEFQYYGYASGYSYSDGEAVESTALQTT